MSVLTQKEFQADLAKMWSEAVEAEYKAQIEAAVLAEREACALLCYEQRKNWDALACADAIRAGTRPRGQA
jgi:hypothetical protein